MGARFTAKALTVWWDCRPEAIQTIQPFNSKSKTFIVECGQASDFQYRMMLRSLDTNVTLPVECSHLTNGAAARRPTKTMISPICRVGLWRPGSRAIQTAASPPSRPSTTTARFRSPPTPGRHARDHHQRIGRRRSGLVGDQPLRRRRAICSPRPRTTTTAPPRS